MKDKLGRIWLLVLLGLIVGLAGALWWSASRRAPVTNLEYLTYEVSQILGCPAYVIAPELASDLNGNGRPEYVFSCDSILSRPQERFILAEIFDKKPQVLLHFSNGQWVVGRGPKMEALYWMLDRRRRVILLNPIQEERQSETLWRMIWKGGQVQLEEE